MSDLILGEDRWASEPSDPIANMQRAVRRILESTGHRTPNRVLVSRATIREFARFVRAKIHRAEKFLRKALLSGRYQKRQRQRLTGRTARRLERRRWYLRQLPQWADELAHWSRLAGIESNSLTPDMDLKKMPDAG